MNLCVCSFSVESLFRETVIHIFQTVFQIIFPLVLTRHLHFCSQMPMDFNKHSLQYPPSLCFIFHWSISWVMVDVRKEKIRNSNVSSYSPNTVCTFMCGLLLVRCNALLLFIFIAKTAVKTRDDSCSKETELRWHSDVYTSLLFIALTVSLEFLSITETFNYD